MNRSPAFLQPISPFKSPFLFRTECYYNTPSRFKADPWHSTPSRGLAIVQIDRRKTRSVLRGRDEQWSSHRKSGTIGAAVGLCRKKTESRGVNIIRGRKGHRGRRLNTPPRPPDFFSTPPSFLPPVLVDASWSSLSFPWKTRLPSFSTTVCPFLGQSLRKDSSWPKNFVGKSWSYFGSRYLYPCLMNITSNDYVYRDYVFGRVKFFEVCEM